MSPRSSEQFEQIRHQKQKHIMEVSLRLFGAAGYHSTSISHIAKEAGISKGLLYNYFDSKEALLLQILDKGMTTLFAHYLAIDPRHFNREHMRDFIAKSFAVLQDNPVYWRLYFQVLLQPGVMEMYQDKLARIYQHFMTVSHAYFVHMGFKNPSTEILLFGALLDGLSLQYILSPETFPLQTIRDELIERYCSPQT